MMVAKGNPESDRPEKSLRLAYEVSFGDGNDRERLYLMPGTLIRRRLTLRASTRLSRERN